ncbi:MAG: 16S rRNA (uracil(1498)-N(3))-methyltransferase [Fimbriimonadaceae bacterium]|nr:16S rRNA (uracil(1498)-N(3))-methyltransferase [Fimbriimonadaceae bacterium]
MPRAFFAFPLDWDEESPIPLPQEEAHKFHNVLRLTKGDQVALLPGDGRVLRAEYQGREAAPISWEEVHTESERRVRLCLALAKPDALEDSIRMATEMGVAEFVLFPSDRSVVRWEAEKWKKREERLQRIVRESAEVAFRTVLPPLLVRRNLAEILGEGPDAQVLSEFESISVPIEVIEQMTLVVGPEGGWAPREVAAIGDRARTLGPRVMRVATAVAATCARALCSG